MKDTRSNSLEQREAETAMRCLLEEEFGPLVCDFWLLSDGSKVEVDAVSRTAGVAIEIFARQGKLLDGQKKKIAKDILKLALISADSPEAARPRLIIAHANPGITSHLTKDSWLAQALRVFKIEVRDVSSRFEPSLRAKLLVAQARQGERFKSRPSESSEVPPASR